MRRNRTILLGILLALLGTAWVAHSGPVADVAATRTRAESGDASAQLVMGDICAAGNGVPADMAEAARWYHRAAEKGEVFAQYNLGILYQEGRGVPQDFAKAVHWFGEAASQGDSYAQFGLACLYSEGKGIPMDYAEQYRNAALWWWEKAASQGHIEAQARLDAARAEILGDSGDQAMFHSP